MNVAGKSHYTFLYDIDRPISLALAGDDLFWSTSKSLSLKWTPKHSFVGTKTMHIEHPYTSSPSMSMQLMTVMATVASKHPCAQPGFNGGCSHICITMNKTAHACLCTAGTVFSDASNTTCTSRDECSFRCQSGGQCITEAERCNGHNNCPDFSDEMDCEHYNRTNFLTTEHDKNTQNTSGNPLAHVIDLDYKITRSIGRFPKEKLHVSFKIANKKKSRQTSDSQEVQWVTDFVKAIEGDLIDFNYNALKVKLLKNRSEKDVVKFLIALEECMNFLNKVCTT